MAKAPTERTPEILLVAGVNGAGKSSVAGRFLADNGGMVYDPDEAARRLMEAGLHPAEANSRAWVRGRRMIETALDQRRDAALETTLGGDTITGLLLRAAREGFRVRVLYIGLGTPELHLQRVRARVARGGHDIAEARIRERWDTSRANLIRLLPALRELLLWDNSAEIEGDAAPEPRRLLWWREGEIIEAASPVEMPTWARPIVQAVLRVGG